MVKLYIKVIVVFLIPTEKSIILIIAISENILTLHKYVRSFTGLKFQRVISNYLITNSHFKIYLHLLATGKYFSVVRSTIRKI